MQESADIAFFSSASLNCPHLPIAIYKTDWLLAVGLGKSQKLFSFVDCIPEAYRFLSCVEPVPALVIHHHAERNVEREREREGERERDGVRILFEWLGDAV